jgi:hypothetical protein
MPADMETFLIVSLIVLGLLRAFWVKPYDGMGWFMLCFLAMMAGMIAVVANHILDPPSRASVSADYEPDAFEDARADRGR